MRIGMMLQAKVCESETHLQSRNKGLAFSVNTLDSLSHLFLGDVPIIVFVKDRKRGFLRIISGE
jgi:hypothetical protein